MRLGHTHTHKKRKPGVLRLFAHVMENEDGRVRKVNVTRVLFRRVRDDVAARAVGSVYIGWLAVCSLSSI